MLYNRRELYVLVTTLYLIYGCNIPTDQVAIWEVSKSLRHLLQVSKKAIYFTAIVL